MVEEREAVDVNGAEEKGVVLEGGDDLVLLADSEDLCIVLHQRRQRLPSLTPSVQPVTRRQLIVTEAAREPLCVFDSIFHVRVEAL
jgi:hypothetical protein